MRPGGWSFPFPLIPAPLSATNTTNLNIVCRYPPEWTWRHEDMKLASSFGMVKDFGPLSEGS